MADSESTTEEEQQLQKQLQNICLEYQNALKSSQSMAPKDINTRKVGASSNEDEVDDDDLGGKLKTSHHSLNDKSLGQRNNFSIDLSCSIDTQKLKVCPTTLMC